ncbi:MAG: BON domain-containing protein [Fuerstiella sp.]
MLIATIKDGFSFDRQQNEAKSSSKFEEVIQEAGVFGQELHCRFDGRQLIIHGRVNNYCQKQLAQEAVRALPGVIEVTNLLKVTSTQHQASVCEAP